MLIEGTKSTGGWINYVIVTKSGMMGETTSDYMFTKSGMRGETTSDHTPHDH